MSIQIQSTVKIAATGINEISEAPIIPVDAVDIINISLPHGSSDLEVEIKPAGAGNVLFLSILSNLYPVTQETPDLSYKIHENTNEPVLMKNIHVFTDVGQIDAVALDFDKLFFSNSHASQDLSVKIFVGRDATPTP